MVVEVKAGNGAIPKPDSEPDSVSALTRFDDAGGLSPATFVAALRQGSDALKHSRRSISNLQHD